MADPETKQHIIAASHTPEANARRRVSLRATNADGKDRYAFRRDPEYRDNQRRKGQARYASEEARQRASAAQAAVADKHSASLRDAWQRRPRVWITDGTMSRQHYADEPIPAGWRQGRVGLLGRALAKSRELQL